MARESLSFDEWEKRVEKVRRKMLNNFLELGKLSKNKPVVKPTEQQDFKACQFFLGLFLQAMNYWVNEQSDCNKKTSG